MTTPTNITVTEPTAGPRKQHWYSWTESTDLTSITINPESPPTPAMKSMAPIEITGSTYAIPPLGPSGYSALASTGHSLDQPMPDTFALDGPWPTGRAPVESWTWQFNTTTGNIEIVPIGTTPPPPPDTIGTVTINGGVNVVVDEQSSFTLTAVVSGNTVPASSLSYVWKLNGSPFPGAPNAASITVSPAETTYTGTWTCTVSSSVAGVSDVDGTLQVTVNAIIGTVTIQGAGDVNANSPLVLTATNDGKATGLTYLWTLNGNPLSETTDQITIPHARSKHEGLWKCEIESLTANDSPKSDTEGVNVKFILDRYLFLAGFSLQKIKSTADQTARLDVIEVRKDTAANNLSDIAVGDDDSIDQTELANFCVDSNSSAVDGFVSRWYDQNAGTPKFDVSQTTANLQPQIFDKQSAWGATTDPDNNLPAIKFFRISGNNPPMQRLRRVSGSIIDPLNPEPLWIFGVTNLISGGLVRLITNNSTQSPPTKNFVFTTGGATPKWAINAGTVRAGTNNASGQGTVVVTAEFNGANSNLWVTRLVNGSPTTAHEVNNQDAGSDLFEQGILIGINAPKNNSHVGPMQEILIKKGTLSTNDRAAIEADMMSRYS